MDLSSDTHISLRHNTNLDHLEHEKNRIRK